MILIIFFRSFFRSFSWAFRISDFAEIFAAKLKMNLDALQRCLWGDFFFDPKVLKTEIVCFFLCVFRKSFCFKLLFCLHCLFLVFNDFVLQTRKVRKGSGETPMFAALCLKSLWEFYATVTSKNTARLDTMISSLNLQVFQKTKKKAIFFF